MKRLIDLNIDEFIKILLPSFLRNGKTEVFTKCLLKPIKFLFNDFKKYREETILEANTTSQTISLENYLNIKLEGFVTVEILHSDKSLGWDLPLEKEGFEPKKISIEKDTEQVDIDIGLKKDIIDIKEDFKVIVKELSEDYTNIHSLLPLDSDNTEPLYMGLDNDSIDMGTRGDLHIINKIESIVRKFNISNKKYSIEIN